MTDRYRMTGYDETIRVISDQIETLADTVQRYTSAMDETDAPTKATLQRFSALHETHARELYELLTELGGNPETLSAQPRLIDTVIAGAQAMARSSAALTEADITKDAKAHLDYYAGALDDLHGQENARRIIHRQRITLKTHVDALDG